jgi:hypothetical protein
MTTKTFVLTKPINLSVRIGHGSINVTAIDDLAEATVAVSARNGSSDVLDRVTVELTGTTLQIAGPRQGGILDLFGPGMRNAIDVAVTVPSGTAVKIAAGSADIALTGRVGSADLAAGASSVTADFIDGDLRFRVGHGNCHVGRVNGSVQFRTGSGGATFDSIHSNVDLASGNGEFRVGIPAGVSARLDLVTGSGSVDSQLPVSSSATGTGKAITIRARTGHGDVHLFRAAA